LRGRWRDRIQNGRDRRFENELVRAAVDDVQVAVFASQRDAPVTRRVHEKNWRRREIVVEAVIRTELVEPLQRAGSRVEHDERIRIEIATGPCAWIVVGRRIANRREELAADWIERIRRPSSAAAVFCRLGNEPGFETGFPGQRYGIESPAFLSGPRIERHEATAYAPVAARRPDEYQVVPSNRRGCHELTLTGISDLHSPEFLTGHRIEREQATIIRTTEQAAVQIGHAAIAGIGFVIDRGVHVAPAQRAITCIECDDRMHGRHEQRVVDDDRIGLEGAWVAERSLA
jgi:hypothetical protein